MKRAQLESSRLRKVRMRRKTFQLALFLVVLIATFSVFVFISRLSFLQIKKITVTGNQAVSTEDVTAVVWNVLSHKKIGLIPESNILLARENNIKDAVIAISEKIKKVDISRSGWNSFSITISERMPIALVCDQNVKDPKKEDCSYIDDSGYIFAPAADFGGSVYSVFSDEREGKKHTVGQFILSAEQLDTITSVASSLVDIGYPRVTRIHLINSSDARLEGRSNLSVFINYFKPKESTISALKAFYEGTISSVATTSRSAQQTYNHIDARYDNKIIYTEEPTNVLK